MAELASCAGCARHEDAVDQDEQHRKIISKWVAQAQDAEAFKEGHIAILRHTVHPEEYIGALLRAHA